MDNRKNVVSSVERLSSQKEGLLEEGDTLSPEAVQLFSSLTSLQPKICAHLQAVQLQPALCPAEDAAQPTTTPPEAQELSSPTPPQPVLLSPSRFLRSSGSGGETLSLRDPPTLLGLSQLVSVTSVTNAGAEGGMAQILLEDGQTIPVQIVDPASIALTSPADDTSVKWDIGKSMDVSAEPDKRLEIQQ